MAELSQKQEAVVSYLKGRLPKYELGETWGEPSTKTWKLRFDVERFSVRFEISKEALDDFSSDDLIAILGKWPGPPAGRDCAVQVTRGGIKEVPFRPR